MGSEDPTLDYRGWQHVILVGVSLSLAYLIAFLTLMNRGSTSGYVARTTFPTKRSS